MSFPARRGTSEVTRKIIDEESDTHLGYLKYDKLSKYVPNSRNDKAEKSVETEHAGGARKNRRVNETITLPAGDYNVYYESDGSHSFSRWNAAPPDDPQSYGVRVLVSK